MDRQAFEISKLAASLRMARAAVGWSQEELAQESGLAKTTLARIELGDGGLRADQMLRLVGLYRALGIHLDWSGGGDLTVRVDAAGVELSLKRLKDPALRRRDRKREPFLIAKMLKKEAQEVRE